jgi:hypothetical protein
MQELHSERFILVQAAPIIDDDKIMSLVCERFSRYLVDLQAHAGFLWNL